MGPKRKKGKRRKELNSRRLVRKMKKKQMSMRAAAVIVIQIKKILNCFLKEETSQSITEFLTILQCSAKEHKSSKRHRKN